MIEPPCRFMTSPSSNPHNPMQAAQDRINNTSERWSAYLEKRDHQNRIWSALGAGSAIWIVSLGLLLVWNASGYPLGELYRPMGNTGRNFLGTIGLVSVAFGFVFYLMNGRSKDRFSELSDLV